MPLYVQHHPDAHTLIARAYCDAFPAGYQPSTEAEADAWIAEQLAAGWEPAPQAPAPPAIPQEIAAWRGRAIMRLTPHGEGTLYDAALAAIASLPEPNQTAASEVLNGATYSRNSPTLAALAAGLGLTSGQVDALFIAADQLPG